MTLMGGAWRGRRFISGEQKMRKVYIRRTIKEEGLYPENKK